MNNSDSDFDSGSGPFGDADSTIRLDSVSLSLGNTRILDSVSVDVGEGAFVELIGPSNAGKTTLLRTLNGALAPDEGAVRVVEEDVHAPSSKATSRLVATVPQTTSVTFDFSVREVVKVGRMSHRGYLEGWRERNDEAVESAMCRTAVELPAGRPVTEISGGECQCVLIARVFTRETPVLLLDEPTVNLGINHQARMLKLVSDLVADGTTVVAVVHDLNLVVRYRGALVFLSGGRVLLAGNPETVLTEGNLCEAFDTEAVAPRHPIIGSVHVIILPPSLDDTNGRIHVVGGDGTGTRALHLLSTAGYAPSVDTLNESDTDAKAVCRVVADLVTVPPYSPVGSAARTAVESQVDVADVIVVADMKVGDGNLANLDATAEADRLVLVEQRPLLERNYAGDDGFAVCKRLRERGRVVEPGDLLLAVGEFVCDAFAACGDSVTGDADRETGTTADESGAADTESADVDAVSDNRASDLFSS